MYISKFKFFFFKLCNILVFTVFSTLYSFHHLQISLIRFIFYDIICFQENKTKTIKLQTSMTNERCPSAVWPFHLNIQIGFLMIFSAGNVHVYKSTHRTNQFLLLASTGVYFPGWCFCKFSIMWCRRICSSVEFGGVRSWNWYHFWGWIIM